MPQGSRGAKTEVDAKRAAAGSARKPPKAKVQSKRLSAETTPKRKDTKDRESEQRLAAALKREKAIGEILRVMSISPGDVQSVLEAVAERAALLCDAPYANVWVREGDTLRPSAFSRLPQPATLSSVPLTRGSVNGRSVLDRKVIHHADVVPFLDTEYPDGRQNLQRLGIRAHLAVPLLRDGEACGTVTVFRREPRPFSPEQIALVETFAQQAVIAIENAQLFNETKEALEQQTATSEILRAISESPTDVQRVFDTIAVAALELCGASLTTVVRFDGQLVHIAAFASGWKPEEVAAMRQLYPRPPSRDTVTSRAILTRSVVNIPDVQKDSDYAIRDVARSAGYRSSVGVPLMLHGRPIGAIGVGRSEVGLFPEKQIALLQTFADQAVIAIENVRLFDEVQAHARELSMSLQQQTATADVLKVISRSAFDLHKVLDTLTESACKLCDAEAANIWRPDGDGFRVAAMFGHTPEHTAALKRIVNKPGRATCVGRALLEGRTVHIRDAKADPEYNAPDVLAARGNRAMIGVPLLREGAPIGVLVLTRSVARPFTEQQIVLATTFADQAVIAIENVRLFNETKEGLERQTATSEILRVISNSPTDVQPVLDAVAERALNLCDATQSVISLVEGANIRFAAGFGSTRTYVGEVMPLSRGLVAGRAIIDRATIHLEDLAAVSEDEYPFGLKMQRSIGHRTLLAVPLIREDRAIGVITVWRMEVRPFTDKQISLVKTFADQAVIAIENVRLFRETSEALERQTATSEILRVISQSPRDVQPVFDTIAAAALKLCRASSATVLTFDGTLLHLAAMANLNADLADAVRNVFPRSLDRQTAAGRAIMTGGVAMVSDVLEDSDFGRWAKDITGGFRSVLGVPLIRAGTPIGAIALGRGERGDFPDREIALVNTFADQAVIAIENVRLFKELEVRNRDLTESLAHQTSTSEILRVISSSPTNAQPVFDIIGERAGQLCEAEISIVSRVEDEQIHFASIHGVTEQARETVRQLHPMPLTVETATGRAIRTRGVAHISDVMTDPLYERKDTAAAAGWRSCLAVPMLREEQVIGAIFVARRDPGSFAESKIELLKTFADQAVIAIENVHLFTELEARTVQLTRSVGELKALGEVGQAVSSTLDLETVLNTIVSRATKLAGLDAGSIWEYDEARGEFHLRATDRVPQSLIEAFRATPIRKGEGALGRMAITGEPVEIRDIEDETSYKSRVRQAILRAGYRSVLTVPLLREHKILGALAVNRKEAGEFPPEVVELLKTFATQSALAIQNARLFREIEDKSRQLEMASRHKSEFLANMSHELRTPLNAIIGFSEVLAERMFGEVNDKQAEYLTDILESGRHLLSLINDILDLSKIEAGRMELELNDFDLPGTIESTMMLLRDRATRHGIALSGTIDERVGMVRADERKVKQVLLNLLSNALKFTPEGGRIDVRVGVGDGFTEISVTDTGIGISPEDQQSVFEEFRQVGTASKKVEGTGLGLAISRKFVELHGGKIWVSSQAGIGSTFTFTLPDCTTSDCA